MEMRSFQSIRRLLSTSQLPFTKPRVEARPYINLDDCSVSAAATYRQQTTTTPVITSKRILPMPVQSAGGSASKRSLREANSMQYRDK
jgi:hypothetical protein